MDNKIYILTSNGWPTAAFTRLKDAQTRADFGNEFLNGTPSGPEIQWDVRVLEVDAELDSVSPRSPP